MDKSRLCFLYLYNLTVILSMSEGSIWNTHNVPAVLCEFCRLRKTAYLCRVIGEFVEGMTTLIAQAVPSPKV